MEKTQNDNSSRLPGFYELPISERAKIASKFCDHESKQSKDLIPFGPLSPELTDIFIENSIGTFSLPLGVATNFLINGKDTLIPMAVEESSVLAAASYGAKLARYAGGFTTSSTAPIMNGQVQLFVDKNSDFEATLQEHKDFLMHEVNRGQDRLLQRGGGLKELSWYYIDEISCLVLKLHINTCDAMGANIVNTMCEKLAALLPRLFPNCRTGLRILTNLTDQRIAKAECRIAPSTMSRGSLDGEWVIRRIVEAWEFAWFDVYRATTHNKGVMNGIDPVVIATGNDWRAVEAGAHAYSCRDGKYRPMTTWKIDSAGFLCGSLELPLAVGTVGGVTRLHPTAQDALKMMGSPNAQQLSEIMVAVGLAQNLSALRALASEGIQQGHMGLHQKNLSYLKTNHKLS